MGRAERSSRRFFATMACIRGSQVRQMSFESTDD